MLSSYLRLVKLVLLSRFIIFSGMVLSNALLPNFDPGDDVLQFDMRLSDFNEHRCFCMQGHSCDSFWRERRFTNSEKRCVDSTIYSELEAIKVIKTSSTWTYLLTPLTRWDASRFLSLATDPWIRFPDARLSPVHSHIIETCDFIEYPLSEQAHAFFPLFPIITRYIALLMTQFIPQSMLPPTFESVVVLAAALWNTVAFTFATMGLFNLTQTILRLVTHSRNDEIECAAIHAAKLFCFNPANVFFISCYSESTFSAFTFTAYSHYTQSKICKCPRKQVFHFVVSVMCWSLASCTRSTGSLVSFFLFINMCSKILNLVDVYPNRRLKVVQTFIIYVSAIFFVTLPVILHDKAGISKHCVNGATISPSWCSERGSSFSFYSFVQRKYWNVGFMRYFYLKQAPNFILASPMIAWSFLAVYSWILLSIEEWLGNISQQKIDDTQKSWATKIWSWALFSWRRIHQEPGIKNYQQTLLSCYVADYYGILCTYIFVATIFAHVQITTRMIASSCPAFYWSILYLTLDQGCTSAKYSLLKWYFVAFNILGVILHVNWLPWT